MDKTTDARYRVPRVLAGGSLLALVAIVLLILHVARPAPHGLWFRALYNAMHGPVFGIIAVSLYAVTGIVGRWSIGRRLALTLGVTLLFAVVSEFVQIATARDASLDDLVTDGLGALSFLLVALAFSPHFRPQPRKRVVLGVLGLVTLAVALLPFLTVSAAYVERNLRFPELGMPGALLERVFWRRQSSIVEDAAFPGTDRPAYRVSLARGPWPGIVFHDVSPDWRGYRSLVVELGNDEARPIDVHFRVHDRRHRSFEQRYGDRYNRTFTVPQGAAEFRVALDEIREAPSGRTMDLQSIDGFALFCSGDRAGRRFYVLGIRLE